MKLNIIIFNVCFFFFFIARAQAEVLYPHPDDTNVILESNDESNLLKGVLSIRNPGDQPWLVQSWVEDYQKRKSKIVFPNLTRLEPDDVINLTVIDKKNSDLNRYVVVLFIPNGDDNESNVLSIPVAYKLKILYKDR